MKRKSTPRSAQEDQKERQERVQEKEMYQNGPLTRRLTQRKVDWIVNMSNSQELRMVVNTWAQNERLKSFWREPVGNATTDPD